MPSLGYNLQRYRQHFLYLVQRYHGTASDYEWPDSMILPALSEAERTMAEHLGLLTQIDTSITVVQGTAQYTLPATDALVSRNVSADGIISMRIKETGASSYGPPLLRRTFGSGMDAFGILDTTPTQYTPEAWALDPNDPTKFYILGSPSAGGTLHIEYEPTATPLWRLWQPDIGDFDASPVYGSVDITISASIVNGNVLAGDEFGVVPTAARDGTSVTGQPPEFWTKTLTAKTTTITLTEAWPGTSESNVAFITAQVPDLEKKMPGVLGLAIPELAAADALAAINPQASALLTAKALGKRARMGQNDSNLHVSVAPVGGTPFWNK